MAVLSGSLSYEPRLPQLHFTPEGTSTDLVLIVAPRGGGKTTLMTALAHIVTEDPERIFVISPVSRLSTLLGVENHRWFGRDKDIEDKWLSVLKDKRRQVVIVDEGDEYVTGGIQGKNGGYCSDALYRLVNYGRNPPWAIGMVWSCRGASDVTTNLIRAANVLFIGRTNEPNALAYVSELLGDRRWMEYIHDLPPYVFVVSVEGQVNGYVKVEHGELEWVDPPKGFPIPNGSPEGAEDEQAAEPAPTADAGGPSAAEPQPDGSSPAEPP